jgi:archaemetzincin
MKNGYEAPDNAAQPSGPAAKSIWSRPIRGRRNALLALLLILLLISLLIAVIWPWLFSPSVGGGQAESLLAGELKRRAYASIEPDDEAGWKRIDPNDMGGWLSRFPEPVQTFEIYKASLPVRPSAERRTIVIQPVGPLSEEEKGILKDLQQYTEIFFQLSVRLEKPIALELPDKNEQWTREVSAGRRTWLQYDAGKILSKILAPRLPKDAVTYMGITESDLMTSNMNFVLGLGSLQDRVGIYSICRFYPEFYGRERKPEDKALVLRRICKTLNHEMGHVFGLGHCVFYVCSMNGGLSVKEGDDAPMEYCPVCHRKLSWNMGFDSTKRYEQLLEFYRSHGMPDEVEWMEKRLENWKRVTRAEKQKQ